MKKKLLFTTILLFLLAIALPTSAFAATYSGKCGDNITYTLDDENDVLTLSGSGKMYDYWQDPFEDTPMAPWNSEYGKEHVKQIVVGEGITYIGKWAFMSMSNATEIYLPDTLKSIGQCAFAGCSSVREIVIPESVSSIGKGAFMVCISLEKINIPANVTSLTLGSHNDFDNVFMGCESIKVFDIHEDNKYFSSVNGVIFDKSGSKILYIPCKMDGEFFIPATVTEVDFSAIPPGVTRIVADKNSAYYATDEQGMVYNKQMTELIFIPQYIDVPELYIPKTVKTISVDYRDWPDNLERFIVDKDNPYFASDEQGGLYNKKMTKLISVPRHYLNLFVVPKGVTTIGDGAFFMSFSSNIILQEGVKTIGKEAFSYALRLINLTIPKSVTTIKDNAFYDTFISHVYYAGSKSAYKNIDIGKNNSLIESEMHYNHTCKHENIELYAVESYATCYEKELHMLRCPDCGFLERRYVGEFIHTKPEIIKGYGATCTEDGLSDGEFCNNCRKTVKEQTAIPATGHIFGEWVIDIPATEDSYGQRHHVCTVCEYKETVSYGLYAPGDVNCDGSINALDATQILRYANGKSSVIGSMSEDEKYRLADVNGDGFVNALDATQILRYANGKSSVLK